MHRKFKEFSHYYAILIELRMKAGMDEMRTILKWLVTMICLLAYFSLGLTKASASRIIEVKNEDSLQSVINSAPSFSVITLPKGVFKENLKITKPLTLKGKKGAVLDGGLREDVLKIQASDVTIDGIHIRNSGKKNKNAGIHVISSSNITIQNVSLSNIFFGIYCESSSHIKILNNRLTGLDEHFSKRGNGIHLQECSKVDVFSNHIHSVQDGVYFDKSEDIKVEKNQMTDSRYALHFMFSKNIQVVSNIMSHNINGLMVMDSRDLSFIHNEMNHHFHFRGYGALLYDSSNILVKQNRILHNSTGLALESVTNVKTNGNLISSNQVGLELKGANGQNEFTENNFVGNIVSSKISNGIVRLDNGEIGNYWDDDPSLDLNGDGTGETPYKAGTLYDRLVRKYPYWQFYFESPAIKLLTKAESMFPSLSSSLVFDEKPATIPFQIWSREQNHDNTKNLWFFLTGCLLLMKSLLFIMVFGRNQTK